MSEEQNISKDEGKKRGSLWELAKFPGKIWITNFNPDYENNLTPEDYERVVGEKSRGILGRLVAEVVNKYVPVNTEGIQAHVLDIAAGTGLISKGLVEKGYRVTAVDLSQKFLNVLKARYGEVNTVEADMNERFPFDDASFDAITTVWANRFIKNTDSFLEETKRALKPGGVFVWPVFVSEIPFWKWRSGLKQPTTAKALAKKVREHGFNNVEIEKSSVVDLVKNKGIAVPQIPTFIIARK